MPRAQVLLEHDPGRIVRCEVPGLLVELGLINSVGPASIGGMRHEHEPVGPIRHNAMRAMIRVTPLHGWKRDDAVVAHGVDANGALIEVDRKQESAGSVSSDRNRFALQWNGANQRESTRAWIDTVAGKLVGSSVSHVEKPSARIDSQRCWSAGDFDLLLPVEFSGRFIQRENRDSVFILESDISQKLVCLAPPACDWPAAAARMGEPDQPDEPDKPTWAAASPIVLPIVPIKSRRVGWLMAVPSRPT